VQRLRKNTRNFDYYSVGTSKILRSVRHIALSFGTKYFRYYPTRYVTDASCITVLLLDECLRTLTHACTNTHKHAHSA